jgi:hypothetical protein
MPIKMIGNPGQAFTSGATWANGANDDSVNTQFGYLINNTGLFLYTGDFVSLDVTGPNATLPTAASDLSFIGVVGWPAQFDIPSTATPAASILSGAGYGANNPITLSAYRTDIGTTWTNGSATVGDVAAVATDINKLISVPLTTGNQLVTITAVTPGTGFTVSANYTGTTGTYTIQVFLAPSAIGPGVAPNSFGPNTVAPIVTQGFCRANCTGLTTFTAKSGIFTTAAGTVIPTYVATGSVTAAQGLSNFAVPLEAYAARDVSLTTLGIAGHETVRAFIP